MTSLNIRRLQYTATFLSQKKISEATGIPQSTLSFVLRGKRHLPKKYISSTRNFFQRTVYNNLRGLGMSTIQAKRFSWYSPTSIIEIEGTMKMKLNDLTLGIIGQLTKRLDHKPTIQEINSLYGEAREKLILGMQKSHKVYEEWLDY